MFYALQSEPFANFEIAVWLGDKKVISTDTAVVIAYWWQGCGYETLSNFVAAYRAGGPQRVENDASEVWGVARDLIQEIMSDDYYTEGEKLDNVYDLQALQAWCKQYMEES